MSISAIGGVSGSRQAHINMADYSIYFTNDIVVQPPQQPQPTSMLTAMMQVLLQAVQQGRSTLGQGGGGGQRGGGFQGGCYGGQAEATQGHAGTDGTGAAEGTGETLDGTSLDAGAHGLLDAIDGLLAAIVPLLGGLGDSAADDGGQLSANDDAFHIAGLLGAHGF